jgi:formylglycine-generating enzyme required for sulfatase activity
MFGIIFATVLISTLVHSLLIAPATASTRTALVIGNSAYRTSPLSNPTNDAMDMAATLKKLGFDVIVKTNADKRDMLNAIDLFNQKLRRSDTGLFFFAGHGMQIRGSNYLIPVDVHIQRERDVEFESVNAGRVLAAMEDSGSKVNIVILDACRDNPFKRSFRSTNRGLSIMQVSGGSFVAYATSPGSVAADGEGRNGIYTKNILNHITHPELTVEEVFRNVRKDVYSETSGGQLPWDSSSLMGRVYLASSGTVVETPSAPSSTQGQLSVSSNVSGAEVIVDGPFLGKTPLSGIELPAGSHRVQVKKEGHDTYRATIEVSAGRTASLEAYLTEQGPKTGHLYVGTTPGDARVRILNIGPKYYHGMKLAPGSYHVEVTANGYEKETRWVTLAAGEDKQMDFRLSAIAVSRPVTQSVEPAVTKKEPGFTNKLGMSFVYIEPGTFTMGSPSNESGRGDDERQHQVTLTRGYYLQTTEVTQGQWQLMMGGNPSEFINCGAECPVERVSWDDVQVFIRRLNQKEGTNKYRLPTEAEWEYAARAGTQTPFYFGTCLPTDQGNYDGKYPMSVCSQGVNRNKPIAVGSFMDNVWGLYDMHGNVSEWCQDWFGDYPSGSVTDPQGPSSGGLRLLRGGSWRYIAAFCRSASRFRDRPGLRSNAIGFRLARTP